ncbi:aminotransferase class IV, partial [Trinickia mobilis]|uniref:aminotransferase class IV n=1 Tax=Trinickia mobilis TaxID=2816356 RepID=UPI001A8E5AE2
TRLKEIHEELISLNKLDDGLVYLQVTRGVQDRNFLFPSTDTPLTLVLFTQDQYSQRDVVVPGFSVMTVPDLRWGRCDVKSTQLLYACMAKNLAQREGYQDAWFVRDGLVTEAASSNVFIVTKDKVVV